MAALPSTGFTTADITSLLSLVSPPGSYTKTTAPEETDTTHGATKTTSTVSPSDIVAAIGGSTSTNVTGASTLANYIGASSSTANIGSSSTMNSVGSTTSKSVTGASDKTTVVGPSATTNTIGATHGSHTTTQYVSPEAVTAYVNQILEGSQGLAATAQQSHASGGYNNTTQGMLMADLVSRTAGQAALLNKSTTVEDNVDASTNTTVNTGYTTTLHDTGSETNVFNSGRTDIATNSGRTDVTNNSGSTNISSDSGKTSTVTNSGSTNTTHDTGKTSTTATDAVTDIVKTSGTTTVQNQTAQISGKAATALAAGTLIYNAAGQLINKATGSVIDTIKDAIFGTSPVTPAMTLTSVTPGTLNTFPELLNTMGSDVTSLLAGTATEAATAAGMTLTSITPEVLSMSPEIMASLADTGFMSTAIGAVGEEAAGTAIADAAASIGSEALALMGPVGAAAAIIGIAGKVLGIKEINGVFNGIGDAITGVVKGVGNLLRWIICTELIRQGRLPREYYKPGFAVFNNYPRIIQEGYYVWAIPSVLHLQKYPQSLYSKLLERVFNWRAENIAAHASVEGAKKQWKGAAVTAVLYPICFLCGVGVAIKNTLKEKYHAINS